MEIVELLQVSLHNDLDDSGDSFNALPDNNDECLFKSISFKSFVYALFNANIEKNVSLKWEYSRCLTHMLTRVLLFVRVTICFLLSFRC